MCGFCNLNELKINYGSLSNKMNYIVIAVCMQSKGVVSIINGDSNVPIIACTYMDEHTLLTTAIYHLSNNQILYFTQ